MSYFAMKTSCKQDGDIIYDCNGFGGFIQTHMTIFWVMLAAYLVSAIMIICCGGIARTVPTNYIILFICTGSISWTVSFICAAYSSAGLGMLVLEAAIMTAAMTFALTLYACTTKTDFTVMGGLLFILSMGMILFCGFLLLLAWLICPLHRHLCGVHHIIRHLPDIRHSAGDGRKEIRANHLTTT